MTSACSVYILFESLLNERSDQAEILSMPHVKLCKLAYWPRVCNLMASERSLLLSFVK